MQIEFLFAWLKPGKPSRTAFKHEAAGALMNEYTERISKFTGCGISGIELSHARAAEIRRPGDRIWLCDRSPGAKLCSSEDLGRLLGAAQDEGCRRLRVLIGGPDGVDDATRAVLRPELRWSFGALTLPHELAAVVAAEQVYRAWTILKRHPYHSGHE